MNKKIVGSIAAVFAVVALVAGGTFAAWTDFDVVSGNVTEAGHLVLDVNGSGPISNVGGNAIAPGEFRTLDFFVASADLDGVPDADLSFAIDALTDLENGCTGNSEPAVDPQCATHPTEGEFSEQSVMRVRYSDPIAGMTYVGGGQPCGSGVSLPNGNSNNDPTTWDSLAEIDAAGDYALGNVAGGEGVCVRIDLGLPIAADDASQGDSSEFDLVWNLRQ